MYPIRGTIDADQPTTSETPPTRHPIFNLRLSLKKLNAVYASLCHTFMEGAGIIATSRALDSCINESTAFLFHIVCQAHVSRTVQRQGSPSNPIEIDP